MTREPFRLRLSIGPSCVKVGEQGEEREVEDIGDNGEEGKEKEVGSTGDNGEEGKERGSIGPGRGVGGHERLRRLMEEEGAEESDREGEERSVPLKIPSISIFSSNGAILSCRISEDLSTAVGDVAFVIWLLEVFVEGRPFGKGSAACGSCCFSSVVVFCS